MKILVHLIGAATSALWLVFTALGILIASGSVNQWLYYLVLPITVLVMVIGAWCVAIRTGYLRLLAIGFFVFTLWFLRVHYLPYYTGGV